MCECDPELVMEFPGISVVITGHKGEGNPKRGLLSTHLLQNTPLLSHVSIFPMFDNHRQSQTMTEGQDHERSV